MQTELVSCVVIVHNGEPFIRTAIASVLGQTHERLELIVVDDGSTDGTASAVAEAADPRLTYLRQDNRGPSAARNTGIARARGDWVAFLDCDDTWAADKLARQVARVRGADDVGLVYSGALVVDDGGRETQRLTPTLEGDVLGALLLGNRITGSASSAMVRRDLLDRVGGWPEDLWYGEDWDLWLRLAAVSRVAKVDAHDVRLLGREGSHGKKAAAMRDSCLRILDQAFATYAKDYAALRRRAEVIVRYQAAVDLDITGRRGEAVREYLKVLRLAPGHMHSVVRLARLLLRRR